MKYIILVIALLLSACELGHPVYVNHASADHPQRIIPVAIDTKFTVSEQAQLLCAIDDWNHSLNGQMILRLYTDRFDMSVDEINYIYDHNGFMLLRISALSPLARNLDTDISAMTDGIGGHIVYFIEEKIKLSQIRYKATHEIAHLLGATHTNYGLMKREYDIHSYQCIDYTTVSQVAAFNKLDVERMNWCIND